MNIPATLRAGDTNCPACGEALTRNRVYCSLACRRKIYNKKLRDARVLPGPKPCLICGNAFVPTNNDKNFVYCSPKCRNTARAAVVKKSEKMMKDRRRRDIEYRKRHLDRKKNWERDSAYRAKQTALTYYSLFNIPMCSVDGCNVVDIDMLAIDHIDNNGKQHKTKNGTRLKGRMLYRWLINNRMPSGYQVLCWNHNIKKEFERRRAER